MSAISALSCLVLATAAALAQSSEEPDVLDGVLVTGEQPGPGLWKLSRSFEDGEHVLWIVGAYALLPKEMTWRTNEVERVLAESQRMVTWARVETDFDVGFFSTLGALPMLFSADRNIGGAKLQGMVSKDAYEQWLVLKAKYLGKDETAELLRPTFAWKRLRVEAYRQSGLSLKPVVQPTLDRLAKKHKVKIVRPKAAKHRVAIKKPRAILKKFKETPLGDAECFADSVTGLEQQIEILKARANAWAVGDVDKLIALPTGEINDCAVLFDRAILSGELAQQLGVGEAYDAALVEARRATAESIDEWFATVEESLIVQRSTVAVVPIGNLLSPTGVLERFRQQGYAVEDPRGELSLLNVGSSADSTDPLLR